MTTEKSPFYLSIVKYGNNILERYIDEHGKENSRQVEYKPTLFLKTIKPTEFTDIHGNYALPKQFPDMKTADRYFNNAKDSNGTVLGMDDYTLAYISDEYPTQDRPYDISKIRIANIDIETPSVAFPDPYKAEHPITTIGMHDSIDDKFYVWNIPTEQKWSKETSRLNPDLLKDVVYVECASEKELLIRFIQRWKQFPPAIVTGWNIAGFDIPYIVNRTETILGKSAVNLLSPWGRVTKRAYTNDYGQDVQNIGIVGVSVLDYIDLYKKFTFVTRPNYRLDTIGEIEVGQNKIEFGALNYVEFYTGNFKVDDKDNSDLYHIRLGKIRACLMERMMNTYPDHEISESTKKMMLTNDVNELVELFSIDESKITDQQAKDLFRHIDILVKKECAVNWVDYQIQDVNVVKRVDEKLLLLGIATSLAYYAGINFETVLATVKPWDAILFNSLKQHKKVVPMLKIGDSEDKFMGAYVKIPKKGFYKDILSFDYTSLYPMCIIQCNISPETERKVIEYIGSLPERIDGIVSGSVEIPNDGFCHSANGMAYTKEYAGVIPIEIEKVFLQRKENKYSAFIHDKNAGVASKELEMRQKGNPDNVELVYGDMLDDALTEFIKHEKSLSTQFDTAQMVRKILINSLYGATGNAAFRYYSIDNAVACTSFGQLAIKWLEREINVWMNKICKSDNEDYIIYIDTDSVYLDTSKVTAITGIDKLSGDAYVDAMNKIAVKIEETVIKPGSEKLALHMNSFSNKMNADREVIADTGFWTGKKRYALNVLDNEGKRYQDPKLKIMGIETQRSSTPPLAQTGLYDAIKLILQDGEAPMQKYIASFKANWKKADYQDVSFVSSANNLVKYTTFDDKPAFRCPGHVKAVIYHNKLAKEMGFDLIREGDKIAVVFLKHNEYQIDQIAYPSGTKLPKQLEHLEARIDYPRLYKDKFEKPLQTICDAISWDQKKTNSLSNFFG